MNLGTNLDPKIETYLADVRARLGGANANEEEQVVGQIAARIQALSEGSTIDSAIELLGPPATVARRYRNTNFISSAAMSKSPLLLLQASLRNGVGGVLAFVVGLVGYWFGGAVAVFGALALAWSAFHYRSNANAAIGASMIDNLATLAIGTAVLVLTTALLRLLLRRKANSN